MHDVETVLMYVAIITAVLQNFLLDALTLALIVAAVGGWIVIVTAYGSHVGLSEQPTASIWDGIVRPSATTNWVCNCVCGLLVPLAVILSTIIKSQVEGESDYAAFLHTLSLSQASAAAISLWLVVTSGENEQNQDEESKQFKRRESVRTAALYTGGFSVCFVVFNTYMFQLGSVSCVVQIMSILIQCMLQAYLPLWCPKNFTFGEATILAQGVTCYFGCMLCNILQKFHLIFSVSELSTSVCSTNYYMEIAMLCCALVVSCVFLLPWCRSILGFYLTFGAVMGIVAIPSLNVLLGDNFISWTINYATETPWKRKLFIYWAECCLVGAVIVITGSGIVSDLIRSSITYIKSHSWNKTSKTSATTCDKTSDAKLKYDEVDRITQTSLDGDVTCRQTAPRLQKSVGNQVSTRTRKLFHLLVVAIFVPGAMKEPVMTCVAATCCLIVFIIMETMRLAEIPPLYLPLQQSFTLFLDDQDQGPVILTHIYLLMGCVLPLWLYPIQSVTGHIALYAGVISLGVGDTMAALVGSTVGRHHWKGSRRTIEGTAACFISQILFILLLQDIGAFSVPVEWTRTLVAVALTSLVEAHTSHVDNLILPLIMYTLLV